MAHEGLFLKDIRKRAAMTQLEMAVYLRVSRSLVALIETGRRSLPLGSISKLNELNQELKNHSYLTLNESEEQDYSRAVLKKEMDYYSYRIAFLKLEIRKMKRRYELNLAKRERYLRLVKAMVDPRSGRIEVKHKIVPYPTDIYIPPKIHFTLRDTGPAARELKEVEIESLLQRRAKAERILARVG